MICDEIYQSRNIKIFIKYTFHVSKKNICSYLHPVYQCQIHIAVQSIYR